MKVISLLQPWASLVVLGHKRIETRSWQTKYRGPLLIHASVNNKMAKQFCGTPPTDPFVNFIRNWTDLPYGGIIGKVNLVSIIESERVNVINCNGVNHESGKSWVFSKQEKAFGDYSSGRFGWLLSDPILFKTPTPAKGKLSIWDFDESLLIK